MDGRQLLLLALVAGASLPALAPVASAHAYCPQATASFVAYSQCSDGYGPATCVAEPTRGWTCNSTGCYTVVADPCGLLWGYECYQAGTYSAAARVCSPRDTVPASVCYSYNPNAFTNLCASQGQRQEAATTPGVFYTTPAVPSICYVGDQCTPGVAPFTVGVGEQYVSASRPAASGYAEATAACSAAPCRATLP